MQVDKTWEDVQFTEQIITPRTKKQLFTDPIITTKNTPTFGR